MSAPILPELIWLLLSVLLAVGALFRQAESRRLMLIFRAAPLALVVVTGIAAQLINLTGVVALAVLALLLWQLGHPQHPNSIKPYWRRAVWYGATLVMLVALMTHHIPGFNTVVVADPVQFSALSVPTKMIISLDKALAGLILLARLGPALLGPQSWGTTLRVALPMTLATIVLVIGGAVSFGYIAYDPKWHPLAPAWLLGNLLLTCIAEEALFRGFLQRHLSQALHTQRYGSAISVVGIALLFGVAHLAGGIAFAALATLAGLGYGMIYARTQSLSAAILAHFSVNLMHFIGYTYPALLHGA